MFTIPATHRFVLTAVVAITSAATSLADTREDVVQAAAKQIAAECKRQMKDTLALGQIAGPTGKAVTTGPGIMRLLEEELKREGIKIRFEAKLGVSGKLRYVPGSAILELQLLLQDELERVLVNFERKITDKEDVVGIVTPPSVTVPINTTPSELPGVLAPQIENPEANIIEQGTRIATADGKYSFEVLVNKVPRKIFKQPGGALAFVELKPKDIYTIRLYNNSDIDTAVKVAIDGLSVFEFAEDSSKNNVWVVDAGKENVAEIQGWYINSRESDDFLVGIFDKEKNKYLKQGSMATISASFSSFFKRGVKIPPGEQLGTGGADNLVTDRGLRRPNATTQIVGGTVGKFRGLASVRYQQPQQ